MILKCMKKIETRGRKPLSKDDKRRIYKNVLAQLAFGNSIRNTSKICDVSVSTVARLSKEFRGEV